MRILVHDYGGYAFSVQLSRELARRGHSVYYIYGEATQLVKRGRLAKTETDPDNFDIVGIRLSQPFQKYSLVRRRFQEIEYGKLLATLLDGFQPEVVISGNTPLDTQTIIFNRCKKNSMRFVFWLQDLIGLATYKILKMGRFAFLADTIGRYYLSLERRLLRQSDQVVVIADDFLPIMKKWGVNHDTIHVIQNWAPLEEIPVYQKNNSWAQENGIVDKLCFLYAGVLGMKHDPEIIVKLASNFQHNPHVWVCVVSEGPGADWLYNKKNELALHNLNILNFQPYEQFPKILASADILMAILAPDAGVYSVPSKILTYLCAHRPLLLAVPAENLAAKIVSRSEAGISVPPDDVDSFLKAAETLADDPSLREEYASNARAYAEEHFDIRKIGDQFEAILMSCGDRDEHST